MMDCSLNGINSFEKEQKKKQNNNFYILFIHWEDDFVLKI